MQNISVCFSHVTYAFQGESTLYSPECQRTPCSKQARNLKVNPEPHSSETNTQPLAKLAK